MADDWRDDPLVSVPDVIPLGVGERTFADSGDEVVFESLRAFLERQLPAAESLVGVTRGGTNLLPRYGWVMPWGREGAAKTSIVLDLLFHAAAGLDWHGYSVARSARIVVVVNEGIPGGFQDKLQQKLESWTDDRDAVLDNLAVYASPWGEFTFRRPELVAHARAYALDFGADYVAFDPLHTLGTSGGGKPEETEAFKHVLRGFGLWNDLGVITSHHSNKSGMVSGDWARHADTVIHLEKDGKNPATKFTLEKARPADPAELGVPFLLEWEADTFGYRRREMAVVLKSSDAEVLERAVALLVERAGKPIKMGDLQRQLGGDTTRVRRVVTAELARENARIRNLSTTSNRYQLIAAESAPPDATGEGGEGAQTRMDTDSASGESMPPDATGRGVAGSNGGAIGGSVGGYVVPPTDSSTDWSTPSDQDSDELDELF